MYLHHLKRLLDAAMPELEEDSKNKILFQQFLAGVPEECSRVLRTNPDITTIDAAVTGAKLLLTVSVEKSACRLPQAQTQIRVLKYEPCKTASSISQSKCQP